MKLILTEKKDAAKMIAAALGVNNSDKGGFFESNDICITWAQGHLIETCPPEYYDDSYKKWSLDHLPIIPDLLATRPMKTHSAKVGRIKSLIKRASVVINACDCGQEGELIARLIFKHAGYNKPHKRLWFTSLLKDEIQLAYADLKNSSDYDYLFDCASLRSFVDWTFGYNLTRAFTLKFSTAADNVINTGRVTTPTMSEIVSRQLLINAFKPEPFRVLSFTHQGFKYTSERLAGTIKSISDFKTFTVTKSLKKDVSTEPPRLFSLNTLQKEANRIFSFKAQKTLSLAEKLYLAGLVTYPRTESQCLPDNFDVVEISAIIRQHGENLVVDNKVKRIFNTKNVSDHHALIPTRTNNQIEGADEQLLYNLIVKRFLAAFSTPALSVSIKIEGLSNNVSFSASKSITTEPGFKSIYAFKSSDDKDFEDDVLNKISSLSIPKQDDSFSITPEIEKRTTKPLAYYTDSTLITFMENAGRVIDEKLNGGIGTVATRAQIIKKLETTKFIDYKGKHIIATEKAIRVIRSIPFDEVKKPFLTLELENLFEKIKRGQISVSESRQISNTKLRSLFTKIADIKAVENRSTKIRTTTNFKCPSCNKPLTASKFSFLCSGADCRFSLPYVICKAKLSDKDHKDLLSGQNTRVIKKLISKANKTFSASLFLDPELFKIKFNFPAK